MRLHRGQLEAGGDAMCALLDPNYEELSAGEQFEQRLRLLAWINPCLLMLPDGIEPSQLVEPVFDEVFFLAAEDFELQKMRRNPAFNSHSDDDLRRRINDGTRAETARHLTHLCEVFLIHAFTASLPSSLPDLTASAESLGDDLEALLTFSRD